MLNMIQFLCLNLHKHNFLISNFKFLKVFFYLLFFLFISFNKYFYKHDFHSKLNNIIRAIVTLFNGKFFLLIY
jgi:hypothetical protein